MQQYPEIHDIYGTMPPPPHAGSGGYQNVAAPHGQQQQYPQPYGHQQQQFPQQQYPQPYGQQQQQYPSPYPQQYSPAYPGATHTSPLPTMPVAPPVPGNHNAHSHGHGHGAHKPPHGFGSIAGFGGLPAPLTAAIGSALGALAGGAVASALPGAHGTSNASGAFPAGQQHYGAPHHAAAAPATYYAAPSAHHHMQPTAGAAVVSPMYCCPAPLDLVVQEGISNGVTGGDSFLVTDTQGRIHFRQSARLMTISDKRTILDAAGAPAVSMSKRLIALKSTWEIFRGGAFDERSKIETVKSNLMTLTPSVSVYLNDGDHDSDYKIRGGIRAKKFTVTAKLPGGGERVVADIRKESRFASAEAFFMAVMTDADKYFVHIEPGVDSAFIVALTTLVDELFHDKE